MLLNEFLTKLLEARQPLYDFIAGNIPFDKKRDYMAMDFSNVIVAVPDDMLLPHDLIEDMWRSRVYLIRAENWHTLGGVEVQESYIINMDPRSQCAGYIRTRHRGTHAGAPVFLHLDDDIEQQWSESNE